MSGTCTYCDNDTVAAGCQGVAMWCSLKCSEGLLGHCYVVAMVLCVVARCLHVIFWSLEFVKIVRPIA